jgi:hypothetical protein
MNLKQLGDRYNKLIDFLVEFNRKKIESQGKIFDKEKHKLRIKAFLPVAVLYLAGLGISFAGSRLISHWWYSLILIILFFKGVNDIKGWIRIETDNKV